MTLPAMPPLLLCVDLEAGSRALLQAVAARLRRCPQPVVALHVVPAALDGDRRDAVQRELEALLGQLLPPGLDLRAIVEVGTPPETCILEQAARHDADPIVLGRRRRTGPDRVYVGSTTSAVISLARRPVLVIPVGGARRAEGHAP